MSFVEVYEQYNKTMDCCQAIGNQYWLGTQGIGRPLSDRTDCESCLVYCLGGNDVSKPNTGWAQV